MTIRDTLPRPTLLVLLAIAAIVLLAGCSAFALPGTASNDGISSTAENAKIQFENATTSAGLDYTDVEEQGIGGGNAGVYAADFDGDGWVDLLTVGGDDPAIWMNEQGTYRRSGEVPSIEGLVKSAAIVDYDGDGASDVLLLRPGRPVVALHNDGTASFARDQVGLGNLTYPLGAGTADYDADGDEDLFVHQSGNWANGKPYGYLALTGTIEDDNGTPNVLYENVGGEYRRVPANESGLTGERWSLAASFVDLTGDGRPDIHVANDYNVDMLYVNQGNGTFAQHRMPNRTARNGMSSEIADVNGDGLPDIFVTNIELPLNAETMGEARYNRVKKLFSFEVHSSRTKGNTLLINQGNGTFEEVANESGLRVGGWGWAASYADLNNDGRGDMVSATQNLVKIYPEDPIFYYAQVWAHRPNGTFDRKVGSDIGLGRDNSRGMVSVDYDHDGDLDLIFANHATRFTVYDNTVNPATTSLQFEVVDERGRTVDGATVRVEAGHVNRTYFMHDETDAFSDEPNRKHVGLGTQSSATLHVTWPDGTQRTFTDVQAGQMVWITRDGVETRFEYRSSG